MWDFIPLAKRWGIENDEQRAALQQQDTVKERKELSAKIIGKEDVIRAWLGRFRGRMPTPEATAFLFMLRGLYEMRLLVDGDQSFDGHITGLSPDSWPSPVRAMPGATTVGWR